MHCFKPSLRFIKSSLYSHFSSNRSFSTHNLEATGPLASKLKSRFVVRFRGPDTVKFLQGLLINDVRRFSEPVDERSSTVPTPNLPSVSVPPMYATLLTHQGRFLYETTTFSSMLSCRGGGEHDSDAIGDLGVPESW